MDETFLKVCDNFLVQAKYCRKMGSPFYGDLLEELSNIIELESSIGRVFSCWQGSPNDDAVALRFVAALHFLVVTKQDSDLCKLFPPFFGMKGALRTPLLKEAIQKHQALILKYLTSPPQTNEVGRSPVLLGGFLEVSRCFGADMDVFEIGASAGLNLAFDQYYYQAETWRWGNSDSPVQFKLNWEGDIPAINSINVHHRRGCDVSPISAITDKERLLSYVWPDQFERLNRMRGALDYVALLSPKIEAMEASEWVLRQHNIGSRLRTRVFYHSIIWQYFSKAQKNSFKAAMDVIGASALASSPVIWMRMEPSKNYEHAELRMTIWPGENEYKLADSGFHGEWIQWCGTQVMRK